MRVLDKHQIADELREIALLLRFHGENRFRMRAYEIAADAVETLREDLDTVVRERRLTEIEGIGDALAATITELHELGESRTHARLREGVPRGFHGLMDVAGLGPKKIRVLHRELGIDDVEELREACERRDVRGVVGFGEKTELRILENIRRADKQEQGHLLLEAIEVGTDVVRHLQHAPGVTAAAIVGSARRAKEIVGDVDVVAAAEDPAPVLAHFRSFAAVAETIDVSETRCRVRLAGGPFVDLAVVSPKRYAATLLRETGSRAHVERLEALGRERGVDLGSDLEIASEEQLYAELGLRYVAPELREDQGEIEAALDGTLPDDLVTIEDVRGLVHCHTTYSDGRNTIEEMAEAADAMGMRYLTITDHSPAASYAGGVEIDRLRRQWDEIARVQEKVAVRLMRGTESDILADGGLDYPDAILERLDVVIASIHARQRMDSDQMTARLVRAMRQPHFKIWGHALGRLLRRRPPVECRVEEVLDAVAESRAAIEINGDPYRLDLEPRWVRAARDRGIRFVISTDAHSIRALQNVRFGVAIARRGWVRRGEVLNALDAESFAAAVRPAA